ncbi:MAG: TMEM165/GDT1 family protein [Nitrospirae bacterium]|nr:TMEM165/GDT1 family protein [Candidatus Manganitrophaceae bacterium]
MNIIFISFLLVALGEMGDKTQLLAFSLAARFRDRWSIMAGILVATVLNHALASSLGAWMAERISPSFLSGAVGVSFLLFGVWALKPDRFEETERPTRFGTFVTTASLFFLAEIGDKTQLATAALAAKYQSVLFVTVGTTLGMLASDGLAVFFGEKFSERVQTQWIRRTAAGLFFLFGIFSLFAAATRRGG